MAYRLLFHSELAEPGSDVLAFRRDVIASDPDWTSMRLLPRPDDPSTQEYLVLEFDEPPPEEQVRDLRYVAARNRLTMVVQD